MSYAVDVNILLYASDASSPYCERAGAFLRGCVLGKEVMCFGWPTIMGYLRMATHAAIFASPLSPDEAARNIHALIRLPHVRLLSEEEGFWEVYGEATSGLVVRGNLVPDAHLAALLRQHGVKILYTNDTDFRKFEFLDVRNPLAESR